MGGIFWLLMLGVGGLLRRGSEGYARWTDGAGADRRLVVGGFLILEDLVNIKRKRVSRLSNSCTVGNSLLFEIILLYNYGMCQYEI